MSSIEGITTNNTFSFKEWLSVSGLTALKDILIKHNMTTVTSISTESAEFAAFISDPLLLPRAMLIPQAIQSFQQLQTNAYKYTKPDNAAQKPTLEHTEFSEGKTQHSNGSHSDSHGSDDELNSMMARFKAYKKDKDTNRNRAQSAIQNTQKHKNDLCKLENKPKNKRRKMVKLKEGDHVKFTNDKKKQGIVRFIGETEFDDGIWYGVELAQANGDGDGSMDGVEYFICKDRYGTFAKRRILRRIKPTKNFRRLTKKQTKNKLNKTPKAQTANRNGNKNKNNKWRQKVQNTKRERKNKRSATLGACDMSQMFGDRSSSKKKSDEYYRKQRLALKKMGPRQIGKIKYKGIKSKKGKNKSKKLKARLGSMDNIDRETLPILQPKLGPRDIGKIKYDGYKMSKKQKESLKNSKFLDDNLSHSTRKLKKIATPSKVFVGVKLGPQEIGRNKYKGTKLTNKQREELRSGKVLEERTHHSVKKKRLHRRAKSLIGTKLGPVDMGQNTHYKGTKMDKSDIDDGTDILSEKTHVEIKKKWHIKKDEFEESLSYYSSECSMSDLDNDNDIGLELSVSVSNDNSNGNGNGNDNVRYEISPCPSPIPIDDMDRSDSDEGYYQNSIVLKMKNNETKKKGKQRKKVRNGSNASNASVKSTKSKKNKKSKVKSPRVRSSLKPKKMCKSKSKNEENGRMNKLSKVRSTPARVSPINPKKKKRKKGKKQKRKKGNKKGKNYEKYKQKLAVHSLNKSETSPAPRHYASESDQEYIENIKQNMYYKESTSPKAAAQMQPISVETTQSNRTNLRLENTKPITPISLKHEEIAHYVHVEPSEPSDSDSGSLAGSLNALSSEEDFLGMNGNENTPEIKWI